MAKRISSQNGSGLVRVLVSAASAIRRARLEAAVNAATGLKLVGSAPAGAIMSTQIMSTQVTPARTISPHATSGRAVSAPALLNHIRALDPDVLLLDLDRASQLSELSSTLSFPETARPAIVVLADAPSPAWIAHALRSGVKSILPRDAPTDEIVSARVPHPSRFSKGGYRVDAPTNDIVSAIHAAHAGLVLLDSAVAQDLARHVHADAFRIHAEANAEANDDAAFDDLTARETEILRMMSEGLANKQIAVALGISEHTVKFHISSILDKLGASSRTEAVTSGIRMGLIFV